MDLFKGARMQKVKDGLIILGLVVAVIYGAVYCVDAIKARNAYEEAILAVIQGAQRGSAPAETEENNGNSEER